MSYTTAVKDITVDAMAGMSSPPRWVSLHTGDPGSTGANEDTGVPRVQTTWGSSSSGVATGSQVTMAALGSTHYTHYGLWSAVTGGTFRWGFALSPDFTYGSAANAYITPRLTFP